MPNTSVPTPAGAIPTPAQRVTHARRLFAAQLDDVAETLADMLAIWQDGHYQPDILATDEFPFAVGLEDQIANTLQAVHLIREREDAKADAQALLDADDASRADA